MEIATYTAIATSTLVATSTAKLNDVPEWFSYAVDIILVLIFLFILFFVKPDEKLKKEAASEEEGPNPLEQVLKTDSAEGSETDSNAGDDVEQRD
ncbi:MAG: hypothetical protein IKO19_00685 [Candidatus Riflebacteria bacterium]|nr:hypothetical protein [Candidatus Riflebacteria bacterium]